MNHIYRVVFNHALGQTQVTSEIGSAPRAGHAPAAVVLAPARHRLVLALALSCLCLGGSPLAMAADYTLPGGGAIGEGNLSIDASGSASGVLNISQTSNRGLINWQSFNVGTDARVNFFAPNAGAVTINLIGGNASSTIAGQLSGNGQVFLVNGAGIAFSSTASVNVGGLVASGLPFNNDHSDTTFSFGGTPNFNEVVNAGTLTATNGSITLLAEGVRNYGIINAAQINLLAAGGATLTRYDAGSGITTFTPALTFDAAIVDPTAAAVINLGALTAGNINLHGRIRPTAAGNVINLGGIVNAQQISSRDGQLSLVARGGDPQSGGGVIQTGTVTADRTVLDVAGDYTQSGSLTTGRLDLAVTGDAMLYHPGNQIAAIGGTVGKNLTVNNAVALGQSGSLSVTGATTIGTGTGNDILLTQAGNRFGGELTLTGGNVTVNAASALQLGKVQATSLGVTSGGAIDLHDDINLVGTLSLDANGALNQAAGNLLVGGTSALYSNSSITLTQLGNSFGNRVALNGAAVKLASSGTLQLGNVGASSLALTAGRIDINGDISTDGAQTYNGAVYLNAAATLRSTNAGNITFGGAVDGARALTVFTDGRVGFLGGVGQTTKVNSMQVQAKGIDLSGNLRTAGLIHLNGPVTLGSAVTLDSELGDINFMSTVNGAHALTVNSRGTSGFYGAVGGTTALTSLTTSADGVTWLGADITTTGGISLTDAVLLGAGVKATSNNGNITFGGTVNGAHALDLRASNGIVRLQGSVGAATALTGLSIDAQILNTQGIRVAGPLQLVTTNSIGQGGAYEVDGDALFHSSGNVFLNNAANRFKGAVDLVGTAVTIKNAGALALRGVDAFTLDVTATGGGISQSRAIYVRGTSSFTADGDITLGHQGNSFGGRVNLAGNALVVAAGSDLDVNLAHRGVNAALALTSAGRLQLQPGAIDTGSADLTLASGIGVLSTGGALSGRNVSLSGGDGVALGHNINATGTLDLVSHNGAIVQSAGNLQAGGATTVDAGSGAINLLSTGNDFVGAVDLSGGDIAINDANALTLGHATATTFRASSTGDLHLAGVIKANAIDLSAGGLFINAVGAAALDVSGGSQQWRIFLDRPDAPHQFNSLDSGNTALWNTAAFAPATAGGNRYLFAWQPTLTFVANTLRKTYGDTLALGDAFSVRGVMAGALGAYKADDLMALFTGAAAITSAGAAAGANVSGSPYQIDIHQGTLDTSASGYALAFAPGQLAIDPRSLIITAGNGSKTYGQNGGLGGYNANGLVNGDTLTSVDLDSNGSAGIANVGDYTITASNADGTGLSNYDITYVDGTLSIGKAGLTITAGNGGKTYGQTGGLGGYRVDGLLNNDAVSSADLTSNGTAATTNVGNYTITASNADGTGLSNYDITYVDGTLSIGKAGLTITAGNGGKTYGQTGGLGGYSVDGLLNNDAVSSADLTSNGTAATTNVGNYTITASNADGTGLSNYDITYVDGVLSIGKAGLTITAGNGGKTYGQTGGLGGYGADGLLNNDVVSSVDLASTGTAATANVGNYTITASNADGTGLSNYDITYVDGVLSIGKAGLIITANNTSKNIGQTSSFSGYTADGLVNGDSIDDVTLFSNGSDLNAQPGGYAIFASDAQGTRLGNYDITYREGTLDVVGVSAGLHPQIAREVAATLSRPAPRALTGSSDVPLYRLNEAAITPASDACTSLGQIQCLARQPE